ncbi:MAG: hypothetical protein ABEJ56_02420 [Candidatus Nanohaloarchaea archaeon]
MSLTFLSIGFVAGSVFGIVAAFFIVRWRINRQLGDFQQNMEQMMDMTAEMDEAFEGMEDKLEVEEAGKEEREG